MTHSTVRNLRIAYAIQNVGGIDFSQDVGDTVPVKYTLRGLRKVNHQVSCLWLRRRTVIRFEDVSNLNEAYLCYQGIAETGAFMFVESGVRRLQRLLRLPYFALFDTYRFYRACYACLPEYELCHEHNGLFCAGAALACWRLGIPYVLTFSADPLFERALGGHPLRGIHKAVAALEARFTYKMAKKIICVSEPARQHLIKTWHVDPEKTVVMPNGVDVELFKPDLDPLPVRAELGLQDEPIIGFVGGFQHWHGLDRLLDSFAQIQKKFPNAKLLLVGDGRARPDVDRKIAELNIGSAVIITGFISHTRVPQMLAAMDVVVLPYPQLPRELWFSPLKLYEYMAAGKAIIASAAGQITEVIKTGCNGVLVEPGNVAELTEAIAKLLEDPLERERLGQRARRQAVEQHSWEKYIFQLEEIYRSCLADAH